MTPQTEAGKRLHDVEYPNVPCHGCPMSEAIVAIEAEARRAALMEARAAVAEASEGWEIAAIDALMDPEPDER